MHSNDDDNPQYLKGKLLIAMPSLGDSRFDRAVIYVCAHDDQGAMGLVINQRISGIKFDEMLSQLGIQSDIQLDLGRLAIDVMNGGPVETGRGFILHSGDFTSPDTIAIDDRVNVTGTLDALERIAKGDRPEQALFILGYAGWGAGQLEQELQDNAWLVVDADPELIFGSDADSKWSGAARKLGIDPTMLTAQGGRA